MQPPLRSRNPPGRLTESQPTPSAPPRATPAPKYRGTQTARRSKAKSVQPPRGGIPTPAETVPPRRQKTVSPAHTGTTASANEEDSSSQGRNRRQSVPPSAQPGPTQLDPVEEPESEEEEFYKDNIHFMVKIEVLLNGKYQAGDKIPWREYHAAECIRRYRGLLQTQCDTERRNEIIRPIKFGALTLHIMIGNQQIKLKDR